MARIGPYERKPEEIADIYAGRDRLAAFKASIEKYPPWPEDSECEMQASRHSEDTVADPWEAMERAEPSKEIDQLRAMCIATRDTLLDHIKAKGKIKGEWD